MHPKAVYDEKDDDSPVPKLGCIKNLQSKNLGELVDMSLFLFQGFLRRTLRGAKGEGGRGP